MAHAVAHMSKVKYAKVWSDWFTVSSIQTIPANCLHNMWWFTPIRSSCITHNYLDSESGNLKDNPSRLVMVRSWDISAFFKHKQGRISGVKQPKATNPLILKASRTSNVSAAKRNVRSPDVSMGTHHWGDAELCCYSYDTESGIILWKPVICIYIYMYTAAVYACTIMYIYVQCI